MGNAEWAGPPGSLSGFGFCVGSFLGVAMVAMFAFALLLRGLIGLAERI